MFSQIYKIAQRYRVKLAGTINVRKYHKIILQIAKDILKFKQENLSELHLHPGKKYKIKTYEFEFDDKIVKLDVMALWSEKVHFAAGFDTNKIGKENFQMIVNLEEYSRYADYTLSEILYQDLVHELTHYFDAMYQPAIREQEEPGEKIRNFLTVFQDQYFQGKFGKEISYQQVVEKEMTVENFAKQLVKKLFKNSDFKKLAQEFEVELTPQLYAILYRYFVRQSFEDAHFFRESVLLDNEKNRELGSKLYYNADTEVKAYTNQIIEEMNSSFYKYQLPLLKGEITFQAAMQILLDNSSTFQEIKDYLLPSSMKKMMDNIYRFFLKRIEKIDVYENLRKAGIDLSPPERLHYRYLMKLYKEQKYEKLRQLRDDEEYVAQHHDSFLAFYKTMEVFSKLKDLEKNLGNFSRNV